MQWSKHNFKDRANLVPKGVSSIIGLSLMILFVWISPMREMGKIESVPRLAMREEASGKAPGRATLRFY